VPPNNGGFSLRMATPSVGPEAMGKQIERIPSGRTVPESGGPALGGITTGPDGNLWFTETGDQQIARITPGGMITKFPLPAPKGEPWEITTGPDGNLWFTELFSNQIGRITPSGTITEFPVPTSVSGPEEITAGPDGNLWFTESNDNRIGRITTGR
jgi:streptogramin lyase